MTHVKTGYAFSLFFIYQVFIGLHDEVLLEIGKAINQEDIDQRNVPLNIKIEIADLEYKKLTSSVD